MILPLITIVSVVGLITGITGKDDSNPNNGTHGTILPHDDCEECSALAGCKAFDEFADSPGFDDKSCIKDYFGFADKAGHDYFP